MSLKSYVRGSGIDKYMIMLALAREQPKGSIATRATKNG